MLCTIKEIKIIDRTFLITLSAIKRSNANTYNLESLDVLMPGTKLILFVTKVLSNGLQITFGKNNTGYINQIYLNNPLSTYVTNMEVTGTLLYVVPTVKLAYFTLLNDISEKQKLNVGDVIKKAKVLHRESSGIVFELTKTGLHGFISLRRTNVPIANIPTKLKQNSTHKCRILSYNWMEHLYVCTMESEILRQKYFTSSDLNLGDTITIKIIRINTKSNFVHVQVGKIRGFVTPEHISDNGLSALNKLKVGDNVEARVINIDHDKNIIKFTLKQSLITSMLPVLHNIHEAQSGLKYHGTITKINKNGLLVRFYGNVKGWVPRTALDKNIADMNWNYSLGQTITVCIHSLQKDEGKMKLRIITKDEKQRLLNFQIGKLIEGTVTESSIEGVHLRISQANGDVTTGFLPAGHMSPCAEIGNLLASKCTPGDIISAFIFAIHPSIILSRTFVTQEQYKTFDLLKVGDSIPCTIRNISKNGVQVILPIENYTTFGFVSYKNISNFELLRVNQILFVKIAAINKKEKQLTLTMALKDVWESSCEHKVKVLVAVDVLTLYLNKLSELASGTFYKDKPISLVTLGQKVTGNVKNITEHGLVLQLDNNLIGTVRKDHYSDNYKVGDKVSGTILWKNYVHDIVDVSLLPNIVNSVSSKQKTLPHLPTAVVLRGKILMITNWLILVLIKHHGVGYLAALPARRHINDVSPDLTPYVIHAKIRLLVVVKANESGILPICMLKSAFEIPKSKTEVIPVSTTSKKLKRKISVKDDVTHTLSAFKKLKSEDNDIATTDSTANEKERYEDKISNSIIKKKIVSPKKNKIGKRLDEVKMELEYDSIIKKKNNIKESKTNKNKDILEKERNIKDNNSNSKMDGDSFTENDVKDAFTLEEKMHISECGFFWDNKPSFVVSDKIETSSDEQEGLEEEPKRKKKKLSAAERREQEREKEREIRQREEALASNQIPNSIDGFDRLVLSSPDSSLVWLQYMAYHLQATEIDKARAVARRAIKTINFREENEALNVWNAWLNLESRFGTFESLNDVFREAVRANDALKIYTHMLTVHTDVGRQIELEKLIRSMIGKFKQKPQVWIDCGEAFLKIGLKEKSRHTMQRALQSLPASERKYIHIKKFLSISSILNIISIYNYIIFIDVNLIVRFANLENKLGDKERSQTLYEQILSSYPKRVDIWSCYVDSLIKSEDIDIARYIIYF